MPGPDDKESQPKSEAVERPWASNDKLTYDNTMTHCKALMGYSEIGLAQALAFQQKANDAYLLNAEKMTNAYMEQANGQNKESVSFTQAVHKQIIDNDRYTLDRLYSVFTEEAVSLSKLLQSLGWTPPTEPK